MQNLVWWRGGGGYCCSLVASFGCPVTIWSKLWNLVKLVKSGIFLKSGKICMQNLVRWKGGGGCCCSLVAAFGRPVTSVCNDDKTFPCPHKFHTKSILTTALHYLGKNLINSFQHLLIGAQLKRARMFTFVLCMRQQISNPKLPHCSSLGTRRHFSSVSIFGHMRTQHQGPDKKKKN